tara:strand:+ start:1519 stop:1839 length:321 start_codon:yes stop_codon:yes gene_type:complete
MGNSNEVVANYVSEEEYNEILRREKHQKLQKANILFRDKMQKIYFISNSKDNLLMFYYGEKWRFLNEFLDYYKYELVCRLEVGFLTKVYKVAMINYLYKWYSNSKC